jgi:hypothetical protein
VFDAHGLIKVPDRAFVVEVHDEATLLTDQQDQFVAGYTPFAVEAAFFFLEFLTTAQGTLGHALWLDVLVLLPWIAHDKPPEQDGSRIQQSSWSIPTLA